MTRTHLSEGLFIAIGDGFRCADCFPPDIDLADPDVEVWEEYSDGWTAPIVCGQCRLSIPVYIGEDDDEP